MSVKRRHFTMVIADLCYNEGNREGAGLAGAATVELYSIYTSFSLWHHAASSRVSAVITSDA